ncbi:hypothetical protein [Neobacillus sp.]|uniref:hypothetical protein n=1 Tax=Neobacillus sp. TaxID=2675273 RepID=UPI00289CC29E|nr:hypothetical protein [Neobacillus sp.]
MVVREARVTDADKLVRLIQQVETESEFMLMEAGERQMTPEQQGQRIESCEKWKTLLFNSAKYNKKQSGGQRCNLNN